MIEWSDLDTPASVDEFIAAAKPPTGLETTRAQLARDLAARAADEAQTGWLTLLPMEQEKGRLPGLRVEISEP